MITVDIISFWEGTTNIYLCFGAHGRADQDTTKFLTKNFNFTKDIF